MDIEASSLVRTFAHLKLLDLIEHPLHLAGCRARAFQPTEAAVRDSEVSREIVRSASEDLLAQIGNVDPLVVVRVMQASSGIVRTFDTAVHASSQAGKAI